MKIYLSSKVHGLRVTGKGLEYPGSITLDRDLMVASGLEENEKVLVVNLNNGERWETYVIPGKENSGVFELNGGSARLGEVGDICMVMAFEIADKADPTVIFVDSANAIVPRSAPAEIDYMRR